MVRIVKLDPHYSVAKEVVCNCCGATLEYVPIDVVEETISDYRGDSETVKHIKCPNCGNKIYVK